MPPLPPPCLLPPCQLSCATAMTKNQKKFKKLGRMERKRERGTLSASTAPYKSPASIARGTTRFIALLLTPATSPGRHPDGGPRRLARPAVARAFAAARPAAAAACAANGYFESTLHVPFLRCASAYYFSPFLSKFRRSRVCEHAGDAASSVHGARDGPQKIHVADIRDASGPSVAASWRGGAARNILSACKTPRGTARHAAHAQHDATHCW